MVSLCVQVCMQRLFFCRLPLQKGRASAKNNSGQGNEGKTFQIDKTSFPLGLLAVLFVLALFTLRESCFVILL